MRRPLEDVLTREAPVPPAEVAHLVEGFDPERSALTDGRGVGVFVGGFVVVEVEGPCFEVGLVGREFDPAAVRC